MNLIQISGLMLITMMISALAIDFGYYFAEQNRLQTAADAAALAAATEMYRSGSLDPSDRLKDARYAALDYVRYNDSDLRLANDDVKFGFIDPATKKYKPAGFTEPSFHPDYAMTDGYNGVYVQVERATGSINRPLKTIMANMFGLTSMDTSAYSVALVDQTIHAIKDGGVRPIYACEAQIKKALEDGILENDVIRIYEDHLEVNGVADISGCPSPKSGKWGFADFSNGSFTERMSSLFHHGYGGSLKIGESYTTQPGDFIPNITPQLDSLIAHETVFPIPFYHSWRGTEITISGFVGFQLTDYKLKEKEASRYSSRYGAEYLEGRFMRYVCNKGCESEINGTPTIGGAVVKLRLASQS
jgi:hypothetical protein